MAGRISAVLLAAEKLELSTEELMEALEANRGSLSTSVRTLIRVGLVQRVGKAADRRHYYRVPPAAPMMDTEIAGVEYYRTLMLHGLDAVRGIHPSAEARLQEYHDLIVFFHNEYKELTERRNNRPKKGKNDDKKLSIHACACDQYGSRSVGG